MFASIALVAHSVTVVLQIASQHPQHLITDFQPTAADMSQLDAPNVYLLWESQRFPLRSLTSKYFVVRCESMVRRHSPNQTPPVLNGTLVSDFGEDIPVLFRVSGTDRKLARCQLSPLSGAKVRRIEQLNSAWQAELMAAAAKRAEAVNEEAKQEQAARESAVVAPLAATKIESRSTAASQVPVAPSTAPVATGGQDSRATATSMQRTGWARYAIAFAVAAGIMALLFFRPGRDAQRQLTQSSQQSNGIPADATSKVAGRGDTSKAAVHPGIHNSAQAGEAVPSKASATNSSLEAFESGQPLAKDRRASSSQTDATGGTSKSPNPKSNASIGSANKSTPTAKRDADRSSFISRVKRQLATENRDLAKLEALHATALERQASKARDSKLSRARKISEAEKELDAVETRIDESESLLEQLAPLIADENIGTAEVQEIKDQLADAKQRRDVKKQELKELRETASLSVSSPETSEIAELSAKLSRKRDEIQRLEREIKGD